MKENKIQDITKENGQLSAQKAACEGMDEQITAQLAKELEQLQVSEELIRKTLQRVEEQDTLAAASEKKTKKRSISKKWYGLAAAASIAVIVAAVQFTGSAFKKNDAAVTMEGINQAEIDKSAAKEWAEDSAAGADSMLKESIAEADSMPEWDMSETGSLPEDFPNEPALEAGETELEMNRGQWFGESIAAIDMSVEIEQAAYQGECLENAEIPEEMEGYGRLCFDGKQGAVVCFAAEDGKVAVYVNAAGKVWYHAMVNTEYAFWILEQVKESIEN